MGLTFFVVENSSLRLIGHTGSQKAFISLFYVYVHPESGTGAIAAFNTTAQPGSSADHPNTGSISAELQNRLMDKIFPFFSKLKYFQRVIEESVDAKVHLKYNLCLNHRKGKSE